MPCRLYVPADRDACLACFASNMPLSFTAEEALAFEQFLMQEAGHKPDVLPYWVVVQEQRVVGCGGLGLNADGSLSLVWGMVHRDFQKKGLGRELLEHRLRQAAHLFPGHCIQMNTSQHARGFFEKYGFRTVQYTPEGYGPDLHRYDLIRETDRPIR